jgi:hypothetical protein
MRARELDFAAEDQGHLVGPAQVKVAAIEVPLPYAKPLELAAGASVPIGAPSAVIRGAGTAHSEAAAQSPLPVPDDPERTRGSPLAPAPPRGDVRDPCTDLRSVGGLFLRKRLFKLT